MPIPITLYRGQAAPWARAGVIRLKVAHFDLMCPDLRDTRPFAVRLVEGINGVAGYLAVVHLSHVKQGGAK